MKIIQIAKILIKQIFKNRKLWQIIRSYSKEPNEYYKTEKIIT